jgi:large subunit ribosomal protein L6
MPPDVTLEVKEGELVTFTKSRKHVAVTGPKGTLTMPLHPFISFEATSVEGSTMRRLKVICEEADKKKFNRSMWGTTNALLTNMIDGVTDGCSIMVRLVGVGYRAALVDGALDLKLGYSHQILLPVPSTVTVQVQNPQRLRISGIDWHEVTKFASEIRAWRPPEP